MIRQFKNFLFGKLSGNAAEYYDGTGSFSTPGGAGAQVYKVGITIDGGGAVFTTGLKGYTSIPVAGNIVLARLLADQVGDVIIDIYKDTFANFPPVLADSICAVALPELSTDDKYEDNVLTGWTVAVAAGDVLAFNVDSVATIERVTLELWIQP